MSKATETLKLAASRRVLTGLIATAVFVGVPGAAAHATGSGQHAGKAVAPASQLACTNSASTVQYAIATADGGLYHTIRYANGNWQPKRDLNAQLGITSATKAVGAAFDGTNVQFVIATVNGDLWHTARFVNGNWQPKGNLNAQLGITSATTAVAAAKSPVGEQFVIATANGGLYHTIRFANGTWQPKGNLAAQLGITSAATGVAADSNCN